MNDENKTWTAEEAKRDASLPNANQLDITKAAFSEGFMFRWQAFRYKKDMEVCFRFGTGIRYIVVIVTCGAFRWQWSFDWMLYDTDPFKRQAFEVAMISAETFIERIQHELPEIALQMIRAYPKPARLGYEYKMLTVPDEFFELVITGAASALPVGNFKCEAGTILRIYRQAKFSATGFNENPLEGQTHDPLQSVDVKALGSQSWEVISRNYPDWPKGERIGMVFFEPLPVKLGTVKV